MSYSIEQRVWAAIWFEECHSITEVGRRFRTRFGRHARAPQRALILRWHENLFKFGNVLRRQEGSGRPRTARSEDNCQAVVEAFRASPRKSIRRASCEMDLSYSAISRVLDESGFKAYKLKVLHAIQPDDIDRRVEFCQWALQTVEDDDNFLNTLIFSDEAIFHMNGQVNKQNCRIWGTEEPSVFVEEPLQSEKVMVWLALSSNGLIGPFFFVENVTGDSYLQMLKDFFWPSVSNWNNLEELCFMQVGARLSFSSLCLISNDNFVCFRMVHLLISPSAYGTGLTSISLADGSVVAVLLIGHQGRPI